MFETLPRFTDMTYKVSKTCAVLVLLSLLHVASPLHVARACCAFSGWVPPEGYVPRRLHNEAKDASEAAGRQEGQPLETCTTLRAPFRPWRQGIPWRQSRSYAVPRPREVLNNSTVVAVASLMQDTKHENKLLQQEVTVQRQEIAGLRTHMSALQLEAELRDFWCKEFKEVRYVGNDTFVVAYTLRL